MIEWDKILETLIAAAAGAAAVVIIDWIVKYTLYKKTNRQEALSIQLALHQVLIISLRIKNAYNNKKNRFIQFYIQEKFNNPEQVWLSFRHVDFPAFMNTFDVIGLDWDLSQFLSNKENKTRKHIKRLIPIKLGYQSLMFMTQERNELLWLVQQKIESIRNSYTLSNFEYLDDNLKKIIGLPLNEKLKSITDEYLDTVNYMIIESYKAFNALSTYIKDNFCHSTPLPLDIQTDLNTILTEMIDDLTPL